MSKQLINVVLEDLYWSLDDVSLTSAIETLQGCLERHGPGVSLHTDADEYGRSTSQIVGERYESDEEYTTRLSDEAETDMFEFNYYLRLKAKYEPTTKTI